ncbi:MAG: Aminopeptidase [Myxococcales bacterium]|nr:Aminopeptidase [Myxococcales bacterium]
MARPDPHSVFDDAQPRLRHLDWRARLDFAARVIEAEARLTFAGGDSASSDIDLDARDLTIERVTDDDGAALDFELAAPRPFLGQRLRVRGARGEVRIRYRTSPAAVALKWLNQSVYTQCQPIYARTIVPLPDSPASRISFRAEVTAPTGVTTLMAAREIGRTAAGGDTTAVFELVKPIPPYLLALAAGDYSARELSPRSRVWATPEYADAAARRLRGVSRLLVEAERIFGAYPWERFDLLVAPVSFPYGGMENPSLAFLSPTLLDDEEGLTSVVAHELAHAWSGNLVSAASAEHFWLNEAFTVWAERKILAAVAGEAVARAHAERGRRDLERALPAFAQLPERTRLQLSLDGVDPDEALSIVPYEKGYLMLQALEQSLGRDPFAAFVRAYVERFADRSITTADFAAFAGERAPEFAFDNWLNQSGLPAEVPPAPAAVYSPEEPTVPLERAALEPLVAVGRIKLLRPIYAALAARSDGRELAAQLYRRYRDGYHPIARQQLERLLRDHGVATQEVNPLGLGRRT